jgi:UDP-glucose 4-epimerase
MALTGTVVVTGARGFLGRALTPAFAAAGCDVRGLVRMLDGDTAARAQFVAIGDLASCSDAHLANALRGASAVVHLAALAHRPLRADDVSLAALRRINVDTTERLARAAVGAGAALFVFASSVKVNGEISLPGRPLCESDPPHPHDAYGQSKWLAERALADVAARTGLRVAALRLPLCYGPGVKANFAALARAVQRGLPLPLAGVSNRRSVLGTGNLADAAVTLLARAEALEAGRVATYFVADAQAVSTADLVRGIARALRVTPRLWSLPPGALRLAAAALGRSETMERLLDTLEVDTAAFRSAFDWLPPHSLDEGLAAAFAGHAPL